MQFNTKSICDAIILSTEAYMRSIDMIAEDERKRLDQVEATIRQNDGKWTPSYIEEYRRAHSTDRAYIGRKMQKQRDSAMPRMMILLTQLHSWVDAVFSGTPSQEFSSIVMTLKLMPDVKLSKHELEVLEGKVHCYAERRIFNALSESYGITPIVKVPDIEGIMNEVDSIENRAKFCLNFYAGADQILFDCIDQGDSMTPVQKIATMTIGRTSTDRARMDALAEKVNRAAQVRELTEEESEKVLSVIGSQESIDNSSYEVQNLVRLSDFGDHVRVIA